MYYPSDDINLIRKLNAKCKRMMNSYRKGHIQHESLSFLSKEFCSLDLTKYFCCKCPAEDIGYCGLRRSNISWEYRMLDYCIPAFIKWSDEELLKH